MTGAFRHGERVLVNGEPAVFVKTWGAGAVIRYERAPDKPRVVARERIRALRASVHAA
jgi:hypothetical protein